MELSGGVSVRAGMNEGLGIVSDKRKRVIEDGSEGVEMEVRGWWNREMRV